MGESEKNRKLFDLLDALEFNQVVIFVKSVQRCIALAKLLQEQNFPAVDIHRAMNQEERLKRYQAFKVGKPLVSRVSWGNYDLELPKTNLGRNQLVWPWYGY